MSKSDSDPRVEAVTSVLHDFISDIEAMPIGKASCRTLAKSALAAADKAAWRPISEAPTDGTQVLLYGPAKRATGCAHYLEMCRYWRGAKTEKFPDGCWPVIFMDGYEQPTHWMPEPVFPAPPSDGSEG